MRAQLAPGTHGAVKITGQVREAGRWVAAAGKADRYRATCRYRDTRGDLHQVERYGATKGAARSKLNQALAEYDAEAERKGTAHARRTLAQAATTWLEQVQRNKRLSDNTRTLYRETWTRCIEGSELASMPLSEANTVPALRRFLQGVADTRGTGTARSARSVLSGVIGLAVDDGLAPMNACRSLRPATAQHERVTERDTRRALTAAERAHLLAVANEHPAALASDVADVIVYMAGTGVRISEALAQRWSDVDLKASTVHVRGSKSTAADRVLALPISLAGRLRQRATMTGRFGYVFPSPSQRDQSKPRDRRNVARIMRQVFDEAGLPWATPHSLRRTAATLILEAGHAVTVAQAQLGHADASMTLRVYAAKRAEPSAAAAGALELL